MNLKFTVVTVVFNGEAVIQKTVESVSIRNMRLMNI